jgi:hemolysin activation/secretion protein
MLGRTYSAHARVGYQESNIEDRIGATATVADKLSRLGTFAFTGDWRDTFGGGGINAVSLTYGVGNLDILSPEARAIDYATARTEGGFQKWNLCLTRLQRLTEGASLYLLFTGQKADKNLDPSEKLILGGPYGVKAYPEGEAPGDTGYLLNVELRYDLRDSWIPEHAQLLALFDMGQVTTNERPFAPGSNDRALSSVGLGLDLSVDLGFDLGTFDMRAVVARKLGNEQATSDTDRAMRGWLQFSKRF